MQIDEVMKDFNKKFKEDLVHMGVATYDYERIPFTSPRLNYMTYGGIPMGKLIEFFGEEHGGKTTTALDIVANYQTLEDSRKVLYVDAENTLDTVWAAKLGVLVEEMIIVNPTSQGAEDIFQFVNDMIDTGEVGLVIIDSLGVMVSIQAMEKTLDQKTYGGISMALTQFSKKAEGLCKRHNCTVIGINQMRDDMNSQFGGLTTTGGRAWKHNTAVRLEFRRGKFIDDKGNELSRAAENPVGNKVLVSMAKNKTCPPTRRVGYYTLRYDTGIDYLADLVEVAVQRDIIQKGGAWFTIVDTETGEALSDKIQGQNNVYKFLEENTEILAKVEEQIEKTIYED